MNRGAGGFQTTSDYRCGITIIAEVEVSAATQLSSLHEKYYPTVEGSTMLKQETELAKQYPNDFGLNFVVSSAEKHYYVVDDRAIECTYLAKLTQNDEDAGLQYGTVIAGGVGIVRNSIECDDKARGAWYDVSR
jgi:hypothetical protein